MKRNVLLKKYAQQGWPFCAGLIASLVFLLFPILGFDLEYLPGDYGDGRFNIYLLEHGFRFISGAESSFWNAPFMYPEENIISYSDNLLGSMPIYALFRILGFNIETATQLWVISLWVLNFAAAYAFLKWMFKNRYAAVLGAVVFAFSIAIQSQMTHAQVFPRFPMPLAIWAALLFSRDLHVKHLLFSLLLVVYQLYCSIYLGLLLALPIGIILLIGYIRKHLNDRTKIINWNARVLLSVVISSIPALLLMWPYIQHSLELPPRIYEDFIVNIPTLKSYIFSKSGSLTWSALSDIGFEIPHWYDHQIFPGGIAFISLLIYIGYLFKSAFTTNLHDGYKKLNTPLLITILFSFIFYTRIDHSSLYKFIFHIPGYHSIGAITRIINVQLLFFAIGTSWVFYKLLSRIKSYQGAIFIVILAVLILDNYVDPAHTYRHKKVDAQARLVPLLEQMKNIPQGSVISYESEEPVDMDITLHIDAMLASQAYGLKSINGYTKESPQGYSPFWSNMSKDARISWLSSRGIDPEIVYVIEMR